MSNSEQVALRQWLTDYWLDRSKRATARDEAVAPIRAAADRMTQFGSHSPEKAEAVARAMVAALPNAPTTLTD